MKLPTGLISVLVLLYGAYATEASQIPFASEETDTPIHPLRTTIVDLLSQDGNYTHLVLALQRSRLIPTINRLHNGSTLFAPTNNAIELVAAREEDPLWSLALPENLQQTYSDNINAQLRRTLLYHLLNVTLPLEWNISDPILLPTMLFPHPMKAGHEKPGGPFPDAPDIHSLLGNASQVLRFSASKDWSSANTSFTVGCDAQGEGGLSVNTAKIVNGTNGVIFPLESGVLQLPASAGHILRTHPSLSHIRSLYSNEALHSLDNKSEITLFAPADHAWEALDEMERRYLASGFAQSDLQEIFDDHLVRQEQIGYVDQLLSQSNGMPSCPSYTTRSSFLIE